MSHSASFPPDQSQRERIRTDLATNLLVEAGAGSGKTTAMVERMVELIRTGTARVEQIAAVTFTRKAAGELRERFQEALEKAAVEADEGCAERERFATALDRIDRCFLGTIHSFCAMLIRERPLEAGVSPDFTEITGAEEVQTREDAWTRYLERVATRGATGSGGGGGSRLLRALTDAGIRPEHVVQAFEALSCNPDVHFPRPPTPFPARERIAAVRRDLERLIDDSLRLMPSAEPEGGWCPLQSRIRSLRYLRDVLGWDDAVAFFDALELATGKPEITLNRWAPRGPGQEPVKELRDRWKDFVGPPGGSSPAGDLLRRWLEFRYPKVLRFARAAAAFYTRERQRQGKLTFHDLLVRSAALLREDRAARVELGERFRYILVDEFQDTDPLQAEILFLLSAEGDPETWLRATPRVGSLFVVGDPKQSIYRFRRADISVYNQVKERFTSFGDVVELTANFRSTIPIERFVNLAFEKILPERATEHQAAYAPLCVDPRRTAGMVAFYRLEGDLGNKAKILKADSERIGSLIQARIREGRKPGDFLILAWRRAELAVYAQELELRNIAFQITGGEPGEEYELRELILLLRAVIDPGNAVLTAAVLRGLFYGVSDQALYDHRRAGGSFSFLSRSDQGDPRVLSAFSQLRDFWDLAQRVPADAAIPAIAEQLGVLPYALSSELGAMRAGAVRYALGAARAAAVAGKTSLADAVEALQAALTVEADAPLVQGETNAVRIMNLHKAKGLEAPVVVLAAPTSRYDHPPTRHIARDPQGRAEGWMLIEQKQGRSRTTIAQPAGWDAYAAAEAPFEAAEEQRLLYVAATRAREELVIARCDDTDTKSRWAGLHGALDADPQIIQLAPIHAAPPERVAASATLEDVLARTLDLEERRADLRTASYREAPVSVRAKGSPVRTASPGGNVPRFAEREADDAGPSPDSLPRGGLGAEWGTAVHQALEAATEGRPAAELRRHCRSLLIALERPLDSRGEPLELDELVAVVTKVTASAIWKRAARSRLFLAEAPFSLTLPAAQFRETFSELDTTADLAPVETVHGVIDLVFREGDGWVVVDYKTDHFGDSTVREARIDQYRRQVEMYATCWSWITGEPVKERVLYLTEPDEEVRW
jgi:ATP-dependent helicase/nuclease subunit A